MEKFEQEFDQYIKSIVDQSEPLVTPQWDHMKQQLDQQDLDAHFDAKIKSILSQAKADGPQLAWDQFNSKTQAQTERKYKILKARAIESILLLLIIWTLNNIGITHLIPEKVKGLEFPVLAESKTSSTERTETPLIIEDNETENIPFYSSSPGNENGFENNNRATVRQASGLQQNTFYSQDGNQNTSNRPGSILGQATTTVTESKELGISAFVHHSDSPHSLNSGISSVSGTETLLSISSFLPLNMAGVDQSTIIKSDIQPPALIVARQIKPLNNNSSTFIGLNTGLMVNSVKSPAFVLGNPSLNQVKLGQQYGLSLNFQSNKWIIETGITYQNLNYNPNISETMGNFEEGYYKILFSKINSQLVNIPVLLHRVLASGPDWQLSSKMGLSISAAMKNNFTVDTFANLNGSSKSFAIPPNSESQIAQRIANKSNQGLLDGGSFGTNSFANIVLGLRWQKQISNGIDFISELELHKMIGQLGYGPNGDKFITTSIKTGISINIP